MVARSSQFRRLTSIGPTMKASLFKPGTRGDGCQKARVRSSRSMARFFLALCGLLLLAVFKWLFDHFLYDWFVQTIESVFGLKEADFEGTAARTSARAREDKMAGSRRTCRGPRGFRVEIQHAIDDRGLGRCRIGDNIADSICRLVEENGYRCFHDSHILRLRCPA